MSQHAASLRACEGTLVWYGVREQDGALTRAQHATGSERCCKLQPCRVTTSLTHKKPSHKLVWQHTLAARQPAALAPSHQRALPVQQRAAAWQLHACHDMLSHVQPACRHAAMRGAGARLAMSGAGIDKEVERFAGLCCKSGASCGVWLALCRAARLHHHPVIPSPSRSFRIAAATAPPHSPHALLTSGSRMASIARKPLGRRPLLPNQMAEVLLQVKPW